MSSAVGASEAFDFGSYWIAAKGKHSKENYFSNFLKNFSMHTRFIGMQSIVACVLRITKYGIKQLAIEKAI